MRAVVIGAVESSRIAAEALARADGWELAAIVSLDPSLRGRHSDFVDLSGTAADAGAEFIPVRTTNGGDTAALVANARPDMLFVIGWSQICPVALMSSAPAGAIGYHPAPLPRGRGRAPIPWTILNEEPITAGTLFWMDEGVDSGPILDQHFFHVAVDETAASLYDLHMAALFKMLERSLPALAAGQARREPQDDRHATWTARRTASDGRIDWNRNASEIHRLIRAVGRPYPGAFTDTAHGQITIWSAEVAPIAHLHSAAPGQVIARDDAGFTVACASRTALKATEWFGPDASLPSLHSRLGGAS